MSHAEAEPTVATLHKHDDAPQRAEDYVPVGVHLVGSVPLGSPGEVFRTVAGAVGDRLHRMPDGETGPRSDWILWQYPVFSSRPQFEVGPPSEDSYRTLPTLRLRDGDAGAGLVFDSLGYVDAATAASSASSAMPATVASGKRPQRVAAEPMMWAEVTPSPGSCRASAGPISTLARWHA